MTDMETTAPAGAETEQPIVTEADMISRGKGMSLAAIEALEDGAPASKAFADFKDFVERYNAAELAWKQVQDERLSTVHALKNEHDIGFSAMAEVMGVTSSLVLYLHERAQGKSAKQIREESEKSRLAKEQFRPTDGSGSTARKQTPEEKAFRKQQREALAAFLASEKAANPEIGDDETVSLPGDEDEDDT